MEDCSQHRTQKQQAEVKQCGPYGSIVLAVLKVKLEREAGARSRNGSTPGQGCARIVFLWTRHTGGGEPRNQSRDLPALVVEAGKGVAQELFFRGDHRYVDEGESTTQHQRHRPAHKRHGEARGNEH